VSEGVTGGQEKIRHIVCTKSGVLAVFISFTVTGTGQLTKYTSVK
jgi:hypothetical protein